jgi:hypothetical protein
MPRRRITGGKGGPEYLSSDFYGVSQRQTISHHLPHANTDRIYYHYSIEVLYCTDTVIHSLIYSALVRLKPGISVKVLRLVSNSFHSFIFYRVGFILAST